MKIPDSVRIGGIEYAVLDNQSALNDGHNMLYGEITYSDSVIRISDQVKGHQMKCVTLLHEILHGINHHAGIEIENTEDVIDMFARGIYQVLQDNGGRLFDLVSEEVASQIREYGAIKIRGE